MDRAECGLVAWGGVPEGSFSLLVSSGHLLSRAPGRLDPWVDPEVGEEETPVAGRAAGREANRGERGGESAGTALSIIFPPVIMTRLPVAVAPAAEVPLVCL